MKTATVAALVAVMALALVPPASAQLAAEIWFPVQDVPSLIHYDNYGDCRSGCSRTHRGNDLMANQMTEVYAAEGGYIRRAYGGDSRACLDGGYCTSYGLLIYGDDGNSYFYLHLNDDTPGRPNGCDHTGGANNAFSPRLTDILRSRGTLEPLPRSWNTGDVVRVQKSELIGYVGSSGNAGCRVDHLHFEMWPGHDFLGADDPTKVDPYSYLRAAWDAGRKWGAAGWQNRPAPAPADRIAGSNRILTSVELSKASFPAAATVVVAPAASYTEALVAGPLAATMDAPVLLTWADGLDSAVLGEISRLGADFAVLVGDTSVLGPGVEQSLADAGLGADRVRRIAGANRYDLSAKVAEQILAYQGLASPSERLPFDDGARTEPAPSVSPLLALGEHQDDNRSWPDALAAGSLAAREAVPILLTRPGDLPAETASVLGGSGIGEVRIAGGSAAVSDTVESQVQSLGRTTRRLAGSTRYATSLEIAKEAIASGASPARVFVGTGQNFPDALASGPVVAAQGSVLVLVNGADASGAVSVYDWLRDNAASVASVTAVGGTAAVRDFVLTEVAIHANWPR